MAETDFTIPYTVGVLHWLKLERDLSIHKVDQDASWTSVAETTSTSLSHTPTHSVFWLLSDDAEEGGQ